MGKSLKSSQLIVGIMLFLINIFVAGDPGWVKDKDKGGVCNGQNGEGGG